jgi:hypothetical protein
MTGQPMPNQPTPRQPMTNQSASDPLVCSARGCRQPATWVLRWNNPKLHTPERRKTWLACDDHLAHLSEFLDTRGFLRDTDRLGPDPA